MGIYDAWLSLYLVAPVRRFWLAPGLLAGCGWLGVLMPSVDSVGRHFPFTMAVPLPPGHDDVLDALPWEYAYGLGGWVACSCSLVRGLPTEQRSGPPTRLSGTR